MPRRPMPPPSTSFTTTFSRGQLAQAQAEHGGLPRPASPAATIETFEGYQPWGTGGGTQDLRHTAVGSFTPFGTTGTGDAVVGDGGKLQVRNDNRMAWGRYSTDGSGGRRPRQLARQQRQPRHQVADRGRRQFNALGFFVIDAADVGGKFSIKVGEKLYSDINAGAPAEERQHPLRPHPARRGGGQADGPADATTSHDDGFGIDGVVVGKCRGGAAAAGRGAAAAGARPPRPAPRACAA